MSHQSQFSSATAASIKLHPRAMLSPAEEDVVNRLGVRHPPIPGGVLLAGTMSKEAVGELSPLCKSWLFLNPDTDANLHKDVIEAAGARLQVILGWLFGICF